MNLFIALIVSICILYAVGAPLCMYIYQRFFIDPLDKAVKSDLVKLRRISEEWQPHRSAEFDSEEERDEAIRRLLSNDGKP